MTEQFTVIGGNAAGKSSLMQTAVRGPDRVRRSIVTVPILVVEHFDRNALPFDHGAPLVEIEARTVDHRSAFVDKTDHAPSHLARLANELSRGFKRHAMAIGRKNRLLHRIPLLERRDRPDPSVAGQVLSGLKPIVPPRRAVATRMILNDPEVILSGARAPAERAEADVAGRVRRSPRRRE
jgi:hypothetical protein